MDNMVSATVSGRDYEFAFEQLGININTPPSEVLAAVRAPILEASGVDICDEHGMVSYTAVPSTNTGVIHVIPKAPAG